MDRVSPASPIFVILSATWPMSKNSHPPRRTRKNHKNSNNQKDSLHKIRTGSEETLQAARSRKNRAKQDSDDNDCTERHNQLRYSQTINLWTDQLHMLLLSC
jgi:hypothetical protein